MKIVFYLKKAINILSVKFYTPINKLYLKLNNASFGKGLKVRGKIYIFRHSSESKIFIGKNVTINSSGKSNPIGCGNKTYIQMVDNATLTIGDNCGLSNTAVTCASSITLEDNVLLGSGCKIYDTDFHALDYSERIKGNYKNAPIKTAPIVIKEGVFIGAGAYILKGVTIGKHSIIGAGSVVTKNIPDNEVWAGNPARFVRKVEEDYWYRIKMI